jgi:hypothetical protein
MRRRGSTPSSLNPFQPLFQHPGLRFFSGLNHHRLLPSHNPIAVKFIIPPVGLLRAVSPRLYDLDPSQESSAVIMSPEQNTETTLLLAQIDAEDDLFPPRPPCLEDHTTKKTVINTVLASGLLFLFLVLCVLLESMVYHLPFGDEVSDTHEV